MIGRSITTVCLGAFSTIIIPDEAVLVDVIAERTEITDVVVLDGSIRCAAMAKHVRMVDAIPEIPWRLLNWMRRGRRSDDDDLPFSFFRVSERAANNRVAEMLDA